MPARNPQNTLSAVSGRSFFRATAILLGLGVVLKAVGAVQQALLAALFGAGPELDAYFVAVALPNLLIYFLVLGPLGLMLAHSAEGDDQPSSIRRALLTDTLIVSAVLTCIGVLVAPWLTGLIAPGFDSDTGGMATNMLRLAMPAVGLAAVNALPRGAFHGAGDFVVPTVAYILSIVILIATMLALFPSIRVYGAAAGMIAGALGAFVFQWLIARSRGMQLTLGAPEWSGRVRAVVFPMLGVSLAFAAIQATGLWARMYASGLGSGAIALLDYSLGFDKVIAGLTAVSAATAVYPALAAGTAADTASHIRYSLRNVVLTSLPPTAFLVALREPAIQLWLERGRFAPADAAVVSELLLLLSPALFAWALAYPVLYAFHALSKGARPAGYTVIGLAVGALLTYFLTGWWALPGIAIGVSLTACGTMLGLLMLLGREVPGLWSRSFFGFLLKVCLVSALGAGVAGFSWAPDALLLDLIVRAALGGSIFLLGLWFSGIEEAQFFAGWLRRRIRG